jgi:hypothetical protein
MVWVYPMVVIGDKVVEEQSEIMQCEGAGTWAQIKAGADQDRMQDMARRARRSKVRKNLSGRYVKPVMHHLHGRFFQFGMSFELVEDIWVPPNSRYDLESLLAGG